MAEAMVGGAPAQAMTELVGELAQKLLDAAGENVLSAEGIIFAVGAALKGFYLTAQIVEGWNDEQMKDIVSRALADAFAFEIKPMMIAPGTH